MQEAPNEQGETMDPDAALAAIRDMYRSVLADEDNEDPRTVELAERIEDLDGWLTRAGFLPSSWSSK